MIFPNEKEIQAAIWEAEASFCDDNNTTPRSLIPWIGHQVATWVIAEIQKRSMVGFEEWQMKYWGYVPPKAEDGWHKYTSDCWQACALSAEARHQETLRVKDAEINAGDKREKELSIRMISGLDKITALESDKRCLELQNEKIAKMYHEQKARIEKLREALKDNQSHAFNCSFITYCERRNCDCSVRYSAEALASDDKAKEMSK